MAHTNAHRVLRAKLCARVQAALAAEGSDPDARHHSPERPGGIHRQAPSGRPEHRRRPPRRPRRPRVDPPMIAKYAIALIVVILLAAAFRWAFLPAPYLPGNRARHLRIRLHLRLHPGKGFA